MESSHKEADTCGTELHCFRQLAAQEGLAGPQRIQALGKEVKQQMERERGFQLRYENLLVERDSLKNVIQKHAVQNDTAGLIEERQGENGHREGEGEGEGEVEVEVEVEVEGVGKGDGAAEGVSMEGDGEEGQPIGPPQPMEGVEVNGDAAMVVA